MGAGDEDARLTVAEAARKLGVSERTTRRLIDEGELPVYRPTRRKIWVLREGLEAFLESHTGATTANNKGG